MAAQNRNDPVQRAWNTKTEGSREEQIMTRIIMHGCCGHMGKVVAQTAADDPNAEIVAGIDKFNDGSRPFPVYTDAADCREEADVIIDFSNAAATDGLLAFAVERKIPVVLCTTGLSEETLAKVKQTAEEIAILRSANMSLGVNVVMKLVAEAARILAPAGFDIEVSEMHHRRKVDAPSGTALLLADSANDALGGDYEYVYGRADRRLARPEKEIGISSLRGGTVVGKHDVVFAGEDEVITITHEAFSRAIFAKGALSAAHFLAGKPAGMYSLADVVG